MFKKLDLKTNIAKFDKNRDISKIKNDEFNLPLVNAKHGDNGIMYYGRKKDWQCCDMCIDIVNDGAVSTGDVYAQPQETGVLYNAYLIKPKIDKKSRYHLLFYSRCIEKTIKLKYGYENKAGWEKIKNDIIQLPTKNNQIDFDFMESFVAELEAQRVAELEAYLIASGLDNYELSSNEKEVIKNYKSLQFEDFEYKRIFNNIKQGRRLKKEDQIAGDIPFVMSGTTNTGVVNYISNPVAFFPKNSITIDIFGNTFYRNYKFGAGDDTGVYWSTENKYSKEEMLFFTTSMSKSIKGKYSYGKKLRSSQSFDFNMKLPIKNYEIDFDIMNTLISAVQKLVIKDVVRYADRKIEETKKLLIKE